MPELRRLSLLFACLALLGGCNVVERMRGDTDAPSLPASTAAAEAAEVTQHLEALEALLAASPEEQSAMTAAAMHAASENPASRSQLRYALMLGLPGHAGSDAAAARARLGLLLAARRDLRPWELALAGLMYRDLEARLKLSDEARRQSEQAAREGQARYDALNRRMQAQSAESARLKQQLEEALAKLEAIAELERNLSRRGASQPEKPQ